jgi:hypothetical protein
MFKYVDASDQGAYRMSARDLLRTDWDLPRAKEPGFTRTVCRGYMGSGASLAIGVMLAGQRSPQHDSTGEHLLLGLEGEIVWEVEGFGELVMKPMDLIFIGADKSYHYWNSGLETARFVDVIGRVDAWPHSAAYPSSTGEASVVAHED